VLVFVAAGLASTAVHTAHEAGWFNGLQTQAVDLTWLVGPGTVRGSLITGMFGLQPQPTVGEALVWLLYAVPMGVVVVWPHRWRLRRRRASGVVVAGTALLLVAVLAGCGSSGSSSGGGGSGSKGANHVKVTLTDAGCTPAQLKIASGPTTFDVTNDGA